MTLIKEYEGSDGRKGRYLKNQDQQFQLKKNDLFHQ